MSTKSIAPGRVQLWWLDANDPSLDSRLPHYRAWLTDDERERETRFRFERDRRTHLMTRALVRDRLSFYAPTTPRSAWRFTTNEYGRPALSAPFSRHCALEFNVSHSHGVAVVAFCSSGDLGVDIERRRHFDDMRSVAQRFFAAQETHELLSLPAAQRVERFFELWTLKEAYIKARGMGLAIPLDAFGFDFGADDQVALQTAAACQDSAEGWQFWRQPHGDQRQLAVAWRDVNTAATLEVSVDYLAPSVGSPASDVLT